MTSTLICDALAGKLAAYVDGSITGPDAEVIAQHLDGCAECRAAAERFGAVKNLLEYAQLEEPAAPAATGAQQPVAATVRMSALAWLSGAPWWFVSCALHVLVIALAGLVSMAIELPKGDDSVIMVTELQARPVAAQEEKKENPTSALESTHDTPATDPTSKDASNIVVPPDIIAKAELGDHFETINPDLPDNHSALGNTEAQSFHSVTGNTEAAGGGGSGGMGMEDVIGVGGAASRGSGGGFGGGDGTGTGVGIGGGHGSFGNRSGSGRKLMLKRHGGSQKTEGAVEKALEWLARNQDQDGHWDAQKLEATCASREWADVGMTSIATLAFLGAGHSERIGKYKDNVQRAVYWLVDKQIKKEGKDKGSWCTVMYANGMATLALAEACGMARNSDAKQAAQLGVEYIQQAQHEYMAWDYYSNSDGNARNDTSVSGWQVMALKSAKVAGLKVDARAIEGAINWLDVGQNLPKDLKDSYDFEGGMMVYQGTRGNISGPSMSMTAAAAMMRLFLGFKTDHPAVAGPCNLMKHEKPMNGGGITVPCTDPYPPACPGKGIDFYYWYYGTFAMFQMGGDHWNIWNQHLKDTLLPLQRQDGAFAGSWDPVGGGRIPDGGRVFSTALGALCMEVYYRYQKLNGDK